MKFIKPNFKKSNLNISSTLAKFLNVNNDKPTLKILEKELNKNYKNVVFMCFDGLGMYPIKKNLDKNNILVKNIVKTLRSTFPSTTTNATTSLYQNKYPLEHGWLGWSLYYKEKDKCVDIYLDKDSKTGEEVDTSELKIDKKEYYFDYANTEYQINSVFPSYVTVNNKENNHVFEDEGEFFLNISNILKRETKQYIYAYFPDPDSTMHRNGVTSKEAYKVINSIAKQVEKLVNEYKDTLFIITADHGQIDINGYIEIYKDEEIMDLLKIYPYLDSRSPCFIVKDGKHKEFEKKFKEKYSKDFKLYKSSTLIKKGYFGKGDKSYLLGDYIGIGTYTHKQMLLNESSPRFKGHHTSLTEEMEVPLILIKNK